MPIDLDDMFTTLGRHADAIPLAPAARARQRGRQRTRARAMVAAAAAVTLIAAGVGAAVLRHDRQAPVASHRGLAPVGAPMEFGGQARAVTAAGTDGRAYTLWQTRDGKIRLNAVDLGTGAIVWTAREPGTGSLGVVHALPQALLVIVHPGEGVGGPSTMYSYDPADGRQRWQLALDADDDLTVHESALVRATKAGRTEAIDWVTGAKRWELAAPADRPVHTLGSWLPVTGDIALPSARTVGRIDDRLIQVTEEGKVQVRDITTGKLRWTVSSARPDRDPRTFLGYDGWLFNDEHECCGADGYRIRATDLRTGRGSSTVIHTEGAGHELGTMMPCAPQRLCVLDHDRAGRTTLSAIDVVSRRQLWRVDAPDQAGSIRTMNGYLLVDGPRGGPRVFDQDGKLVLSLPAGSVHWFTRNTLLTLPVFVTGPASKVTVPDGRVTVLGDLPPSSDSCAWTTDRLICPTSTNLRIWRISG